MQIQRKYCKQKTKHVRGYNAHANIIMRKQDSQQCSNVFHKI